MAFGLGGNGTELISSLTLALFEIVLHAKDTHLISR